MRCPQDVALRAVNAHTAGRAVGRPAVGVVSGNKIGVAGGKIGYGDGALGQAAVCDGNSGVRLPDGLISGSSYGVSLWLKPQR